MLGPWAHQTWRGSRRLRVFPVERDLAELDQARRLLAEEYGVDVPQSAGQSEPRPVDPLIHKLVAGPLALRDKELVTVVCRSRMSPWSALVRPQAHCVKWN